MAATLQVRICSHSCIKRYGFLSIRASPKSRFPQILHDDAHFLFQEAVAELVVADGFQFSHEGVVLTHPAVERLESGGLGVRGTIQLGGAFNRLFYTMGLV